MENQLTKSVKKFIRSEKARIRSQFLDVKKQDELIGNLYKKLLDKPVVKKADEAPLENPEKTVAVEQETKKAPKEAAVKKSKPK
ncbi:MAG: hypothetical protein A3D44_02795 [Candidatus Staskawiczbacteria bacterium RIFCSPHIGHO2_02_FULL_42_22]|uniref:Uncharacterized protein n=1 Tax=Candidatus Staskawiczbacteria bacterium RIFCSPHIGHO2_02_FULL_42_22 TaxID=1802207 RepID=A0A1G2I4E8_9BACT|nr:MAG: hypothetical protein A3D44_02795 [Candidatus Staskawiczbacteria bacterium RIFCSPHIGHO2_02_FULL_42_22]